MIEIKRDMRRDFACPGQSSGLTALLDVPMQQIVDACGFVVGNASDGVGEPGFGSDTIQHGGFDQAMGDYDGLATRFKHTRTAANSRWQIGTNSWIQRFTNWSGKILHDWTTSFEA